MNPTLYIIAGCNGAGKTTASFTLLPSILNCYIFINADEIAREIAPGEVEKVAFEAGRQMIEQINARIRERETFAFETTLSALSSCLTYACRRLRWIDENPCFNLIKLKESKGRDRILSEDEASRLIISCKESRNPYLFCIVLFAITTALS